MRGGDRLHGRSALVAAEPLAGGDQRYREQGRKRDAHAGAEDALLDREAHQQQAAQCQQEAAGPPPPSACRASPPAWYRWRGCRVGAGAAASAAEGGATTGGGSGVGVTASEGRAGVAGAGTAGTWLVGAGASGAAALGRWRRRSSSSSCSRLSRARTPLSWSCSDATPLRALMAISKAMKPTRMTRNSIPTVPRLRASRARTAPARIMPRQGQPNVNQQPSHLARNCGGRAQRLSSE